MDVKEVARKKKALEDELRNKLNEFSILTGVSIQDINIVKISTYEHYYNTPEYSILSVNISLII